MLKMDQFQRINPFQDLFVHLTEHYSSIILDNIFPNPIRYLMGHQDYCPGKIKEMQYQAESLEEILKREKKRIVIPFIAYQQFLHGYGTLSRIVHRNGLEEETKSAASAYSQKLYSLLWEARSHIFTAPAVESYRVHRYVNGVIALTERRPLKKPVHKDDKNADEILVATAHYLADRDNTICAIVTKDKDIGRISEGYAEVKIGRGVVDIFTYNHHTNSYELQLNLKKPEGLILLPKGSIFLSECA